MEKNEKKDMTAKVAESQEKGKRITEKTVTLTVSQLEEISVNINLAVMLVTVIRGSKGNMKGNLAFAVAKELSK